MSAEALLPVGLNPYWAVWLAATGGGPNHEYMIWNGREWTDFDKRNGFNERQRPIHKDLFKAQLVEKYAVQITAAYGQQEAA
jgi:hypothetical protein